jgi:heme/copper-type cytochrome/quinol oxidase subunit 2
MVPRPSLSRADPVHEVQVMAKKFAFEPSIIQVVAGEPVRLVIRSGDAVHGFAIRDLNIDVQTPRGGATVNVEFTRATRGALPANARSGRSRCSP